MRDSTYNSKIVSLRKEMVIGGLAATLFFLLAIFPANWIYDAAMLSLFLLLLLLIWNTVLTIASFFSNKRALSGALIIITSILMIGLAFMAGAFIKKHLFLWNIESYRQAVEYINHEYSSSNDWQTVALPNQFANLASEVIVRKKSDRSVCIIFYTPAWPQTVLYIYKSDGYDYSEILLDGRSSHLIRPNWYVATY